MSRSEPLDLIAGRWSPPAEALGGWIRDASDGALLQEQRASSAEALDRALDAARRAHEDGSWAAETRATVLERIAGEIEAREGAIAEADARMTGVVLSLTRRLARVASLAFRNAAALVRGGALGAELAGPGGAVELRHEGWGPAAIIAPWNAPSAIAAHKVASALAAGCPVVLKGSEWAPRSCQILAEAARAAGVPGGVLQLVHGAGEVGARLVADPRVRAVSFTGGLEAGLSIARACAGQLKPMQLELGGNNPLVVLEDADLDLAARGIAQGLTTLNGQWCRAVGRIFVPRALAGELVDRVMARLSAVRLGSALATASEMGPLAYPLHLARVRAAIGALVERGGVTRATTPVPDLRGNFLPPTLLLGVSPEHAREEIFGPVATVHPVESEAAAVAAANDSPYGLAAYVFGGERAFAVARRLRAGSIKVNGVSLLALHPSAPRPAWGLSGYGDEGTRETLRFFCGTRVIGDASKEMAP